jgi:hypothetical protein
MHSTCSIRVSRFEADTEGSSAHGRVVRRILGRQPDDQAREAGHRCAQRCAASRTRVGRGKKFPRQRVSRRGASHWMSPARGGGSAECADATADRDACTSRAADAQIVAYDQFPRREYSPLLRSARGCAVASRRSKGGGSLHLRSELREGGRDWGAVSVTCGRTPPGVRGPARPSRDHSRVTHAEMFVAPECSDRSRLPRRREPPTSVDFGVTVQRAQSDSNGPRRPSASQRTRIHV